MQRPFSGFDANVGELVAARNGENAQSILLDATFQIDLSVVHDGAHVIFATGIKDAPNILQFDEVGIGNGIATLKNETDSMRVLGQIDDGQWPGLLISLRGLRETEHVSEERRCDG
ncbi:hypothetical protein EWM64_g944 [Hericium alpestre]|uniref:Uncharacterized protein n=1 Tax=Hericium alpestre TaxID=135208 RepID=A0A4Z0ABU4_9AGAM|nr:hypothetical protein EWM64_g944 [Hericium alpestre]